MTLIVEPKEIEEAIAGEIPGASKEAVARIVAKLSQSARPLKEVAYQGQIGADMMVNCEDVCVVGEMHSRHRKMRIFVED